MDANGFAFPSLRTWAAAARMSVNTLRKLLETAVAGRWIVVDQRHGREKGWAQNRYRCVVPNEIELSEKDQMLADALVAKVGDIEIGEDSRTIASDTDQSSDGVSTHADTPRQSNRDAVSTMNDTPNVSKPFLNRCTNDGVSLMTDTPSANSGRNAPTLRDGVSNGDASCIKTPPLVCQSDPHGVSNGSISCVTLVDTEVLKSEVLEVLEVIPAEGAVANDRTLRVGTLNKNKIKTEEPKEARLAKARTFLSAVPDTPIEKLALMYSLTDVDVQQLGSQAA
jgi:hypothetical protein